MLYFAAISIVAQIPEWREISITNEVRVFHFKLHELPVLDTAALSTDELSMAKAHADIQDQQMFIACRTALKKILGAALSIPTLEVKLHYGRQGKPYLSGNTGVHFNVSHTRDIGVIAVCSHGEIGIDIESYDRELNSTKLRDYLLSPSEMRMWKETRGAMRISSFIDYWVAKEAFSKAVGIGHSKAINEIEVELGNDEVKLQACWPGYTAEDWAMSRVDVSPSHSCIISFKKPYA